MIEYPCGKHARLWLLTALLLGACTPPAPDNATAPAGDVVGGNALSEIAKLNRGQLEMVLFRAIRDAGQDCQDVVEAKPAGRVDGRSAWYTTCRGKAGFLVAIGADGIAHVTAGRYVRGTN